MTLKILLTLQNLYLKLRYKQSCHIIYDDVSKHNVTFLNTSTEQIDFFFFKANRIVQNCVRNLKNICQTVFRPIFKNINKKCINRNFFFTTYPRFVFHFAAFVALMSWSLSLMSRKMVVEIQFISCYQYLIVRFRDFILKHSLNSV